MNAFSGPCGSPARAESGRRMVRKALEVKAAKMARNALKSRSLAPFGRPV
jgi:hypothetical protein